MAHEFKPGDLALIIGARCPDSIGEVAELLEYVGPLTPHPTDPATGVEDPNGKPAWHVKTWSGVGYVYQHNLMPLKGDEQPAQVRQAERVQ